MKLVSSFASAWLIAAAGAQASTVLAPGDFIIGISARLTANPASNYPAGEPPQRAIDGVTPLVGGNKYLNFGQAGSGFIATPAAPVAMQSFTIGTGGDASERDPSRYEIWGTNNAIASADNSNGRGEEWVLLSVGTLSLPTTRNATSSAVNIANTTAYASYKVIFPSLRNNGTANSMQIGEFTGYTAPDAGGTTVFAAANPILAIDAPVSRSSFPAAEGPANLIDGTAQQKYLNFGGVNSGFIVTPNYGSSVVRGMLITSANDTVEFNRGPTSYEIYGTNSAISSYSNTTGDYEPWTLISSGAVEPTVANFTEGPLISFANETAYTSYKVLFPTLMNPNEGLQIGEIQFVIPEPSIALLSGVALLGLGLRRRR